MASLRFIPLSQSLAEEVRARRTDAFGNVDLTPLRVRAAPGYPCRVCLEDAAPGEEVLLFSHSSSERAHPFRSVGPVYIHLRACQPPADPTAVPAMLRGRLLSLRGLDASGAIRAADVTEGTELEALADRLFADPRIVVIDVHMARYGCFACRVERS